MAVVVVIVVVMMILLFVEAPLGPACTTTSASSQGDGDFVVGGY